MLAPEEDLLAGRPQNAAARQQMATMLTVAAMIVLMTDIVLRRLSWEAAVLKWLRRERKKSGEDAKTGRLRSTPGKGGGPGRREDRATPAAAAADTADKLLQAQRERRRMG